MRNISKKLLEYYDKHKRDLAWRGEVPAYYTWISEIMLQQTRVEAVKPYFARFIEELPTIEALELALGQYKGGVVIVSHDQDFIENIGITEKIKI